jgi:hypothetical protein
MPKTLKLLQEIIGKTLENIGIGNYFLSKTLVLQEIKARMDKWDFMKLKFLHLKRQNYQNQETTHGMGEKSLVAIQ